MDGLQKAIKYFDGKQNLARALGVHRVAVDNWRNRAVPAARAREIEILTRGAVTREELNPALFGPLNFDDEPD